MCLDDASIDVCQRHHIVCYAGFIGGSVGRSKFQGVSQLLQAGYHVVLFDLDAFVLHDPLPHMKPLNDDTWDIQCQRDHRTAPSLNLGWVFSRASLASIHLWTKAGQVFDHTKEWDQRVFNEVALNMESLALLRIHRLDVEVFRSFMFENFTEYYVNEKVPENTVLFHMTCADKPVKGHISRTLGLFTSPVNYCDESHKYFALINPMYGTLEQLESSMQRSCAWRTAG